MKRVSFIGGELAMPRVFVEVPAFEIVDLGQNDRDPRDPLSEQELDVEELARPNFPVPGQIMVEGDLRVEGDMEISGSLTVTGEIRANTREENESE